MATISQASRTKRVAAAVLLAGVGVVLAGLVTPGVAHAAPGATGPLTWCPGQPEYFGGGQYRPNWDWNVCHTYWTISEVPGNVAPFIWEGEFPPAEVPLEGLSRPAVNCGLFYCQDPGGRYTVDPRVPAP